MATEFPSRQPAALLGVPSPLAPHLVVCWSSFDEGRFAAETWDRESRQNFGSLVCADVVSTLFKDELDVGGNEIGNTECIALAHGVQCAVSPITGSSAPHV
jgi:hypothetical protein